MPVHEWFHDCEYVNPDSIAQDELGDWNDAATVLRAAQLATERRETCLREGRSLAFETVFSAADKPEFVRRALALGYFVRIFFVGTARPEINAARVARRVIQGGHEVPRRQRGSVQRFALQSDPAPARKFLQASCDAAAPRAITAG